jgi:antitoxin VapB
MSLDIRDDEVERLATQLAAFTRTTKTEAVRDALRRELKRVRAELPLWLRLEPLRNEISAYPDTDIVIDKTFFDELGGETVD